MNSTQSQRRFTPPRPAVERRDVSILLLLSDGSHRSVTWHGAEVPFRDVVARIAEQRWLAASHHAAIESVVYAHGVTIELFTRAEVDVLVDNAGLNLTS
jgi:hypothetical protein